MIPKNLPLLIDSDTLVYRAGFAAEKVKYLVAVLEKYEVFDTHKEAKAHAEEHEGIIWSRRIVEPEEVAISNLKNCIKGITGALWPGTDEFTGEFYLTGPSNFRFEVAVQKEYKGNRVQAKPKHYRALREYLTDKCGAVVSVGQEADDDLGIQATSTRDKCVIVTNDKDLDQIPGWHYNWVTHEEYYVDDEQATRFFYKQLLTGDRVDNIPGIVSEAKADLLLEGCTDSQMLAEACMMAYKHCYFETYKEHWADKLEEIADLVYIRTVWPGNELQGTAKFWKDLNGT